MQHQHSVDASGVLPGPLGPELRAMLASDENVQVAFEVDLTPDLRFAPGLLVLTERRLLARGAEDAAVQQWPLAHGMALRMLDHGGVGQLELHDERQRLALWRFTLGRHPQALHLQQRLEQQIERLHNPQAPAVPQEDVPRCAVCGTPLPPDSDECPACARQQAKPTSTWVLLRLWRFARPYKKQLGTGFALTLASTAASLVPPYMTIPLMDDILIPYQSGKQIPVGLVLMYLGGLLGAALLAWGLGWARTYILALASERIGADLRTTTYEHLLRLSLDYFGSKRTGDLMARIGSETDRINVFLSLNALDFATDVLMIIMTSVILFSINPWLALVTLVPLPFIAWLIHNVRDRLRTGFEKIDRVWSEVTNILADTIPGIRVVKAFAQEGREAQRFRAANQHNLEVNDKLNKTWSLFAPTVSLMTEVGLLVVWGFGIWLVAHNQITVGVLAAFIAYIGRFYTRLDSMSRIVSVTQKAAAGAKRIFDILDHVSNVPDPVNPVRVDKVAGAIEMRDVGFRYGSRSVIKNLSLQIRPGEMIGLVGHSGSGKST
ncbi:MAG TPA: ABC transporter transmembrane domain-containing protein, partial [Alicycliphilus sp.]|nr:ABC transporter transmembrane domain-containing protein [Alicycliphilus sp.]